MLLPKITLLKYTQEHHITQVYHYTSKHGEDMHYPEEGDHDV